MNKIAIFAIILVGVLSFGTIAEATGFGFRFRANNRVRVQKVVVPQRVVVQKQVVQRVVVPQKVVVQRQHVVAPQRVFIKEVPALSVYDYGHGVQKVVVQQNVQRHRDFIVVEKVVQPQKVIIQERIINY